MEEDITDSARVRRSLKAHRAKHPEPLSARENADAMGLTVEMAAVWRDRMEAAGLLRVEQGYENRVPYVRTWLTSDAVRVADAIREADEWAKKARDKHGKKR